MLSDGYGLRINDEDRILEFGHTGFHPNAGYTAVNLYYPKSNTSVIVIENQAMRTLISLIILNRK